jgi:hypothetical protein
MNGKTKITTVDLSERWELLPTCELGFHEVCLVGYRISGATSTTDVLCSCACHKRSKRKKSRRKKSLSQQRPPRDRVDVR